MSKKSTIDGIPVADFLVKMMYETNVQKKSEMREMYKAFIIEQAKHYDEMENECTPDNGTTSR